MALAAAMRIAGIRCGLLTADLQFRADNRLCIIMVVCKGCSLSSFHKIFGGAALFLMLSTAACGGGGGEGGLSSPAPLAPKRPATDFSNDPEFDPCYTDGVNDYCVYGLSQIGAQYAYAEGATGAGVVVAVVDTGIDATHEELNANVSVQSKDIANGAPISDMVGHGTFVAGIIAAEKNGFGFHGVAFGAKILAIRVDTVSTDAVACSPDPPPCSLLFDSDIAAGITYATGRAHIINLSLGGPSPSPEMEQPLIDAAAAGAIIVVSTGNESLPGS
ncbi:MAG: S8 family serine peptidase, partial [Alphaproteobacteria bacterium]|nr:S8 family serine peptidase [Alphaproteobacteria bacterium]